MVEKAELLRVVLRFNAFVVTKTVNVIDDAKTGELFAACRKDYKLSQRAAAASMGVSAMHLCNLERGRSKWSVAVAEKAYNAIKKS